LGGDFFWWLNDCWIIKKGFGKVGAQTQVLCHLPSLHARCCHHSSVRSTTGTTSRAKIIQHVALENSRLRNTAVVLVVADYERVPEYCMFFDNMFTWQTWMQCHVDLQPKKLNMAETGFLLVAVSLSVLPYVRMEHVVGP